MMIPKLTTKHIGKCPRSFDKFGGFLTTNLTTNLTTTETKTGTFSCFQMTPDKQVEGLENTVSTTKNAT